MNGANRTRSSSIAWMAAGILGASLCVQAQSPAAERTARYAGILPCADCPALRMDLTLHRDRSGSSGTYEQRLTYVDRRGEDKVERSTGSWTTVHGSAIDPAATLYRLTDRRSGARDLVRVEGERALRIVDDEGRDIPSPRPQVLWRAEPRFAGAPLVAGKADARRAIALRPGQELVVRLAANPTTGYRWTTRDEGEPALAMTATPAYKRDAHAEGLVGSGGVETWRFLAFRPGRQRLSFEYRRPWERDAAAADTVTFDVQVR